MSGKSSKTGTIFVKWLHCSRKSVLWVMNNYNIAWQPRPSVGIPGDWCGSNRAVDIIKGSCLWAQQRWSHLGQLLNMFKKVIYIASKLSSKKLVVVRDRRHSTWKIYHSQCGGSTIYSSLCTGHNDTDKWIALKVSPSPVLLTKCSFSSRGMCVVW